MVSKKDIVVMALHIAGGAENPIDTEHIAIGAHRLAPETFRWRFYPDHIDLESVRRTLAHAENDEKEPRIEGSVKDGWNLTPLGEEWIAGNAMHVVDNAANSVSTATTSRNDEAVDKRELARLKSLPGLAKFKRGEELSRVDAGEVFRVDIYTPARQRHMKVARLKRISRADPELHRFAAAAARLVGEIESTSNKGAKA